MPRAQTTAFILSQFKTRGAVHYLGLSEQNYCGSQPDPEKVNIIISIPTYLIKKRHKLQIDFKPQTILLAWKTLPSLLKVRSGSRLL